VAPIPRTATTAVFSLLSAPAPGVLPSLPTCPGTIGDRDPVAIVTLQGGAVALRDFANPSAPISVCAIPVSTIPIQLIDSRHLVISGNAAGLYAVVDLPSVTLHWFQLPSSATTYTTLVSIAPGLDAVVWMSFEKSGVAEQVHLTTAAGDSVLASLPSRGPGRCGSPEDSKQGAFASGGDAIFVLPQDDPGQRSLFVSDRERPLFQILPPAGSFWSGRSAPAMAVWAPTGSTLYFRQGGDVWRWTRAGGSVRLLPGVAWYYPTIAPDGRHIAYAVVRGDGFHDVYLLDVMSGAEPTRIGLGARTLPQFLTSTLLWYRADSTGICGPGGAEGLVYDLSDKSESPSAIRGVTGAWPATSSSL